jgi:pyrroline-5-carboxylate reductase
MKIAVIGCGNMAKSVVEQIYKSNKSVNFYTYTPSQTRALDLANIVNGIHVKSLDDFDYDNIDIWLFGFKPQQVNEVKLQFNGRLKNKKIVSMLAAISIEKVHRLFGSENILRIMPNTPIGLGEGVTLYLSNFKSLSEEFMPLLEVGSVNIETDSDTQLDELTVFSGSGPAYIFYFALSLQKKMIQMGYSEKLSRKLINQLFLGSSKLIEQSSLSLDDLINQVTSKGGVTIEAIKSYRDARLNKISSDAIDKALEKANYISRELG